MNRTVVAGIWIATVVLAWFLGAATAEPESSRHTRTDTVVVETTPDVVVRHNKESVAETPLPKPEAEEPPPPAEPFSHKEAKNVNELSDAFMKYVANCLRRGPEGHRELYRAFDQMTQDRSMREFFRDEAQLTRLAYPWLKFLMKHDRQLVAMTETVYKTAAEDPGWFEGTDDDTLEIFVEGLGTILPGVADDETMDRFRGYVRKIIEHDREAVPDAMKRRLRDFARNLDGWEPPLSQEEMLRKVRDPATPDAERVRLLMKVSPSNVADLDFVALVGPSIERGDSMGIHVLGRFLVSAGDIARIDGIMLEAAALGRHSQWNVLNYLQSTRRVKWTEARAYIEQGLARGDKATEAFAQALCYLRERPDPDYVSAMLTRYSLSDRTVQLVKQRFGLK